MTLLLGLALAVVPVGVADAAPTRPDVVLITLEAIRADHVGARRDGASITPVIDTLGAHGAVFESAMSQAPWTVPSLASLMTSRYADEHRTVLPRPSLEDGLPTLVSALRAAGYQTAAFVSGAPTDKGLELTRPFDTVHAFSSKTPDMEQLVAEAERWISSLGGAKYFVWIHAFNTHLPYQCPQPYRDQYDPGYKGLLHQLGPDMNPADLPSASLANISKFIYHYNGFALTGRPTPHYPIDAGLMERVSAVQKSPADIAHFAAHYDGCLNYSDAQIGRLKKFVDARGKPRGTLWVVTSDHGEYLGRAAWTSEPRIAHPFADLHEELLHVPLVISGADLTPGRVSRPVELIDVAPTVLAVAGLAVPAGMRGRDLFGAGAAAPDHAVYASDYDPDASRWVRTIRKDRWKLVRSTSAWSLYDLQDDPGERVDVSRLRPREFVEAARGLLEFGAALAPSEGVPH